MTAPAWKQQALANKRRANAVSVDPAAIQAFLAAENIKITTDHKAFMAYNQNNAANTGGEDIKVSVRTADAKSKAKEKMNPSSVPGSLQSIFGIEKGSEFSLSNGGKEKKYQAIKVARIQAVCDNDDESSDGIASMEMCLSYKSARKTRTAVATRKQPNSVST